MQEFIIASLLRLLALLPLRLVHGLAAGLGRLALALPGNRATCVSRANIRLCRPDLPPEEQEKLVRDSLIETAKAFAELGALWLWPGPKALALVRQVSGEELLRAPLQQGRGVVLLTPHLGAWEMAGLYASAHYPITSLYRPSRFAKTENLVRSSRERCGARLVPTDGQGLRALHEALRRGQVAGILPDHEPTRLGKGVFAPFFGVPAFTAMLVPRLAQKMNAKVVFTYAERLPAGQGIHVHYLPAPEGIYSENIEEAVAALNRGIENCVRRCPAQYQWAYKRFKSRPEGQEAAYRACGR